jgi:rfaE bifunctional protein kinase chain/domain/rfaE bifunctional protein nucleotidyltransferase chain/domain
MPRTDASGAFDLSRILYAVNAERWQGKTIVQCHGVFDLLHPGHLDHLVEAKSQGDVLVVTLTADRFVNKGPGRPVFTAEQRASMLNALQVVDFVAICESQSAVEAIETIRPDVFVKGPDYQNPNDDVTGNISLEESAVISGGGRVYFTQAPTMSSSRIINAHLPTQPPSTTAWLDRFRSKHDEGAVLGWLDKLKSLNVLVIGEAIIDEYVRCEALGKSSKDPVLAFREISTERQVGGSLAIASHCAGLGANVIALFRIGDDPEDERIVNQGLGPRVRPVIVQSTSEPTIVKRRYIDDLTEARVFESYIMHDGSPAERDDAAIIEKLKDSLQSVDLVLVADYGHGLLTDGVIAALIDSGKPLAVNTQSNAGNRGFNTISRYPRVDFVCLNGGEMALELRRRHMAMDQLLPQLRERTGARRAIVTEGAKGLACCDEAGHVTYVPAFAQVVRDRVGAGDALFAATALLSSLDAPPDITGFFGNLAGAASVAELGNRRHVSAVNLTRHASVLLK